MSTKFWNCGPTLPSTYTLHTVSPPALGAHQGGHMQGTDARAMGGSPPLWASLGLSKLEITGHLEGAGWVCRLIAGGLGDILTSPPSPFRVSCDLPLGQAQGWRTLHRPPYPRV